MSNASLKQTDLSKIKWVQTNYMTVPAECLDLLNGMESKDPFIVANKHNLLAIVLYFKSEYFEALENCKKSIEISKKHNFHELEIKTLINKSGIYIRIARYNLALECCFESLKHKFDRLNSMSYNNLAMVYKHLGNYEKQLEFQSKAKSINEKVGEKRLVVLDTFNIADFYYDQGNFKKALAIYEDSLKLIKKHKFYMYLPYIHGQIAMIHFDRKHYKLALENSNKALKYLKQYETDDKVGTLYTQAKILNHYKKYDKALAVLDDALTDIKIEKEYGALYELKIEIESKHKPESLASTYRDYNKLLKLELDNGDEKNEMANILKYKEKEYKEIQNKNEAIELQNRELEVVSKLLAHDLKTPIRTIGSFVNLIKNKLKIKNDTEINEYIEYISTGTEDIYKKMEVTEKFLNFKLSENKTQFDLNTVLDRLINNFQSDNRNIKITSDKDLPVTYGDKKAIRNVFQYLFQFIIKHSKKEQININFRHETNGIEDIFFITDDENTMQFAQYWFEETFQTEFFKTGKVDIGFAFVRKIITLHHGHLLVDEGENGNPLLKIWLPVLKDD